MHYESRLTLARGRQPEEHDQDQSYQPNRAGRLPASSPMKTSIVLCAALAASPAFVLADSPAKATTVTAKSAVAAPDPVRAGLMQVTVNVPPSMRPFISDQIAEAFADRVAEALRRQGCKARIKYLDSTDTPATNQPLLAINLIEWRTDRIGSVDCTFSAAVTTPKGNKSLGLFTGTSMMMFPRRDWLARSDQFDDAAHQALNDLYKRISETNLLSP